MAKVFITYRRTDSGSLVGRLYDRLVARYGRRNVYKDVDNIPPGANFADHIRASLKQCVVQLVIVGPQWADVRTPDGQRRLDDPTDWVRVEIETGLSLGLTVIPVLLGGGQMPGASDLPESLRPFAQLNALMVRDDPDFTDGLRRVTAAIDRTFATRVVAGGGGIMQLLRWRLWILRRQLAAIGIAMLLLTLFGVLLVTAAQSSNPETVAQIVNATNAAVAAKTAAASATEAAQTAVVVAAQATQTASAQATATAALFAPYTAAAPGPGCDTNGGQWTSYFANPSISCGDKQHTVVTTPGNPPGFNTQLSFQWPQHPFPERYVTRVTVLIQTAGTYASFSAIGPNSGSQAETYAIRVADSGQWVIFSGQNPTAPSGSGTLSVAPSASAVTLSITVDQTSVLFEANSTTLQTVPRISSSSLANGSIKLTSTDDCPGLSCYGTPAPQDGIVSFSDFLYQATM
jgi:hypothetical protein